MTEPLCPNQTLSMFFQFVIVAYLLIFCSSLEAVAEIRCCCGCMQCAVVPHTDRTSAFYLAMVRAAEQVGGLVRSATRSEMALLSSSGAVAKGENFHSESAVLCQGESGCTCYERGVSKQRCCMQRPVGARMSAESAAYAYLVGWHSSFPLV